MLLTDVSGQGKQVAEDIGSAAAFCQHDVSEADSWAGVMALLPRPSVPPSILINTAGVVDDTLPIENTSVDVFDRSLGINLKGVFLGMRAVVEPMKRIWPRIDRQHRLGGSPSRRSRVQRLCQFQRWCSCTQSSGRSRAWTLRHSGELDLSRFDPPPPSLPPRKWRRSRITWLQKPRSGGWASPRRSRVQRYFWHPLKRAMSQEPS